MNCWVRLFKQLATKSGIEGIFFKFFFLFILGLVAAFTKTQI